MNIRNPERLRALLAASALFALTGGSSVLAQTVSTPSAVPDQKSTQASTAKVVTTTTTEKDKSDSDVVVLSPFTVTADTEGYQAVDTLGGARVATKLVETPSAISVVTKSFLDDTGITNAQDLLIYTTNTEVAGLNGNFSGVSSRGTGVSSNAEAARLLNPGSINRSRGLSPMDNTRNYFGTEIPWDSFNISRIDISRGPNSFLFGTGSPSGISNYSTNQAVFKNQGTIEARIGSFGTTRESLDYNRVIIPGELAARIDVLNNDTQYQQKPAFNHAKRIYGAIRYEPKALDTGSSHMKIDITAESGRVRSNNPRELPPMDFITGYFAGQGLNKSGYDPFIYNTNQTVTGIGSFSSLSPWVNNLDYHYIWPGPSAAFWYDGTSGALLQAMTTFNGAKNVNGSNFQTFPQAAALYTTGFSNYAKTMNYRNSSLYPGAYSGTVTYNDKSLTDSSIFNFYDSLIDGPNKEEWQNWKAFNVTVEQSFLKNRVSLQAVVDHQEFDQGQASLFGYSEPFISVDLDAYSIMYPSWLSSLAVANPYEGRAFVAGDFGSGDNSAYYRHNNYQLTVFGDLRSEDFLPKGKRTKILGHHTFTGLVGEYKTDIESRAWAGAATDTTFAAAMGDSTGVISSLRGVQWVSYLSGSLVSRSSASGLNLSNISNPLMPRSTTIKYFNNTWTATSVSSTDAWTDPSPYTGGTTTQAENPANYKGWTTMPATVLNWKENINDLYTSGTKTQQMLKSRAFMYQGHMFDDSFIPEFGWRRDSIRQSSANAPLDPNTHVANMNYGITSSGVTVNTTSKSYGFTLRLPESLRGKLPLGTDVSLYYFHGANETPKVRYGFDAGLLPNESGKTDDFGIQVDTLNGHATVRLTVFKTLDKNAQAGSGAADPLGNNGYYLYLLPAWGVGDAATCYLEQAGLVDAWGFSTTTSTAERAAGIAGYQANFAKYFSQSFFDAYGLGVNVAAVTSGNWANVYNSSAVPFPWNIANTGSGKINGSFPIVSQDIESKGFEIEATVRPIRNWDLTFNASKVKATQVALGASTSAFVMKEKEFFSTAAGKLPLWGYWGGTGGGTSTLYSYFMQNIWSAYQLQTAQTGTMQPELSKWNFKAITNYTFNRGVLKGFNVGGGVRWASKPILGYGIALYTDSEGNQTWVMDAKKPLYGKIDQHADMWIGYQRKLTANIDWKVQLNVRNVGENPHLVPVSVLPDGTWAQQRIE